MNDQYTNRLFKAGDRIKVRDNKESTQQIAGMTGTVLALNLFAPVWFDVELDQDVPIPGYKGRIVHLFDEEMELIDFA